MLDTLNQAKFWTDNRLTGVDMLHASFKTLEFAPHVHDALVIAVTEEGTGRFRSNNKTDMATPWSILIFNPGEPHSGGVAPGCSWRYRALYLDMTAGARLLDGLAGPSGGLPYFRNNKICDETVARQLLNLHATWETRTGRLDLECGLLSLMARLIERHAQTGLRHEADCAATRRMRTVRDFMHDEYATDLPVSQLASMVGLSQFHFIRAFRRQFGLSPNAYLNQIRLRAARRLLAGGNSIADTAAATGFYDQSHLIKHFKRTFGITPGQYAAAMTGAGGTARIR